MREREYLWDSRHVDNKVRGQGITNKIAQFMEAVAPGKEWRKKAKRMTAMTGGGGLKALQHPHTTL